MLGILSGCFALAILFSYKYFKFPDFRTQVENSLDSFLSSTTRVISLFVVYLILVKITDFGLSVTSKRTFEIYYPVFLRIAPLVLFGILIILELGLLFIVRLIVKPVHKVRIRLGGFIAKLNANRKETVFAFISFILIISFLFAIMELALRLFRPQPTYSVLKQTVGSFYMPGGFNTFTLRPNFEGVMPSQEYPGTTVPLNINSLGLRGEEVTLAKPSETKRILVLGDSYTFGVYVANDETYPAVLQTLLRQEGKQVQVLNAGYADGWDPDEHYAWLLNRGLQFQPDLVIYGFFAGNDISELYPEYWKGTDGNGLPLQVIDDRYYVDSFGEIRSTKESLYTVGTQLIYKIPVLRESHVAIFLASLFDQLISQPHQLLQLLEGVPVKRHFVSFPFLEIKNSTSDMREQEKLFLQLVEGLSTEAHKHGAEFLVIMLPVSWQVNYYGTEKEPVRNYYQEVKPIFDEMGIHYIDMFQLMIEKPGHYFPDNGELHNNPEGYRFIAEQIKAYLEAHNLP
jgi:lysophospholipase L1-like esterase